MRKFLFTITIFISFALGLILPNLSYASSTASQSQVCQGVGVINGTGNCDSVKTSRTSINSVLSLFLNLFTAIVGFIALITIIISGLRYITSGGSSEKTNEAKNTILYAVIGLVIVALAQIIVHFVLHKAYKL
jgi:cytochrome bd-type quinol oxidase subunit 2